VALKLGFCCEDYGYAIDLGLPIPDASKFVGDPVIKLETLWMGEQLGRANVLAERRGPSVRLRDKEGSWAQAHTTLAPYDSMMTHCADSREGLELLLIRERMRGWRFYDNLRTDAEAPARRPQVGTRTPALAGDGSDLAAAIETIREIGDASSLEGAIDVGFPGCTIDVVVTGTHFELEMRQPGLLRPLKTTELSEGTLKFLLLVAALLSPRPPSLMILNEPETSLHSDLVPALAQIIGKASVNSQIIVVSHSEPLTENLRYNFACHEIRLRKELGETGIESDADPAHWIWPKR
jgi:predicted ATPase